MIDSGLKMRIIAMRSCITVTIKEKPPGCTADISLFRTGKEKDELVDQDFMTINDRNCMFGDLEKGRYRIAATLEFENGERDILEEFCDLEGDTPYNKYPWTYRR